MMRITTTAQDESWRTTLAVEGWIVGRHAELLATECKRRLASGEQLVLNLTGVPYVDARGASTLATLRDRGVAITGCSPFVQELIKRSAS